MLSDMKSPETYFQTAFRSQSPYYAPSNDNKGIKILKDKCYLFDFSPFRSFRMVHEQTSSYKSHHKSKEEQIQEVLDLLPVLSMDGSGMKELSAEDIIDFVHSGTTGTLLARKWESPLLVNIKNGVIERILRNPDVMRALEKINGFKKINSDFEFIVNTTNRIKEAREKNDKSKVAKKQLSEDVKKRMSKRKEIQEKLIKFASRIPIFMYLTDSREICLRDLITTVEPQLFYETTGLTTEDFDLLQKVGLFDNEVMDVAVWDFRRYEDDSFAYIGLTKREGEKFIGGFSSVAPKSELLG